MNKKQLIVAWVIGVLLLSGCSATPILKPFYSSRKAYVENHPALNYEIKQAILDGKVIVEMTKGDVKAAWGKPNRIESCREDRKDKNCWRYRSLFLPEPVKYVQFKEEKVFRVYVVYE